MLERWSGRLGAVVVTAVTVALVVLDLLDRPFRRWWTDRALTTDTVAGVLVLLLTVLVVDQVVKRRQIEDRSQVTAAQAAILLSQATRSVKATSAAMAGVGDRAAAADEVRIFMMMLLIAGPALIDGVAPRQFLRQAQHLAGALSHALVSLKERPDEAAASKARLDAAVDGMRNASAPILKALNTDQRTAVEGPDPIPSSPERS